MIMKYIGAMKTFEIYSLSSTSSLVSMTESPTLFSGDLLRLLSKASASFKSSVLRGDRLRDLPPLSRDLDRLSRDLGLLSRDFDFDFERLLLEDRL